MSQKIPVDNDTRQIRAVSAAIATTIICMFFAFAGCEAHSQKNPPASRCLQGTTLVEFNSGWGCVPISEKDKYANEH